MNKSSELRKTIRTPLDQYCYYDLRGLLKDGHDVEALPFSIRILLENIIRNQNGMTFTEAHLKRS